MEKEQIEKVDWKKELYGCLEYCKYQNGRDDCKNCGLEKVMIDGALQEAYQAGIRRAMEIVRFQDDNGGYMSDILTAPDAELHGNKTTP